MVKKTFERSITVTAVQFNPEDPEWHHSIQVGTLNGKIHHPENPSYSCIIPLDHTYTIHPGDWIIVDDMNNATGIIFQFQLKDPDFWHVKELD
jgi:hypothetical protein